MSDLIPIARLVLYAALIISATVILDWLESRRLRSTPARRRRRGEPDVRRASRSPEETQPQGIQPRHERRTAA